MLRYSIFFWFILVNDSLLAQHDTTIIQLKPQKIVAFTANKGNVLIHTEAVENIRGAKPFGFSIEVSKQQINQASYNNSSSYARFGWQLSYYNFNTPILGNGTIVNYFLQPIYKLTNRLQFSYRASIGAAYLSSPYNAKTHIDNQNYSSHIVPYMHISAALGYRITNHLAVELNTNFHHLSNGNLTQPNKGLNFTTTGLSLVYNANNNILPTYHAIKNRYWKPQKPWVDVGVFYVPQQDYYNKWQVKRHFALGLTAQISKQVGRTNALLVGGEAYYNSISGDVSTKFLNNNAAVLGGLFIGHEFLLNRLIFSQNIGLYVTSHPSYNSNMYFRLGLRYKLNTHWQIGANLKAHSDEADFFDIRFLYRF
ncbi:MAG: acyloxyacyl hydrolase [Pedobacter sp.]|nr:acyloxyacyl hydrolase [Chitinophagaceae bacterium]